MRRALKTFGYGLMSWAILMGAPALLVVGGEALGDVPLRVAAQWGFGAGAGVAAVAGVGWFVRYFIVQDGDPWGDDLPRDQ